MPIGKFIFVWIFSQLEAGRPPAMLVEEAVGLGLGMVAVKIADGASVWGASGPESKTRYYIDALHSRGIQVWGWQYLYGGRRLVRDSQGQIIGTAENTFSTPETESSVAIQQMRLLGLDGYIMDPEAEYKSAPPGRAARFMSLMRAGLGNSVPFALCSYRYPNYHPELPWLEFLGQTNYHMPQVYWGEGPNRNGYLPDGRLLAQVELDSSVAQLRRLRDLPFLPVGRVYIGDGHSNPQAYEINAFLERSRTLGFEGAGFWNWDSLRPSYPGSLMRAQAIRSFPWVRQPVPGYQVFLPIIR